MHIRLLISDTSITIEKERLGIYMALFGFIGSGNMGFPLLKAAANTFGEMEVLFTDASAGRREEVFRLTGISSMSDNCELAKNCKYLVFAVKPQVFPQLLSELKGLVTKEHIIISIAAGISIDYIKEELGRDIRIVRAMPNTPAMVYKGMTAISFSADSYTDEEQDVIKRFFASFGKYEIFDEKLMNAVVCANGSSPAYVYLFIEALADSVVSLGIPRDKAYTLVAQTVLGAAAMVLETGEHPAKLKDNVCSPGGTTIAAIKALEEHGFRNAIMKATDACFAKAEELGQKK